MRTPPTLLPLQEKITQFREDFVLQNKANQGIKEDLCPQMTQIHADGGEGEFQVHYLRESASSAGNSGFGCGWPRWVIRGSVLFGSGWLRWAF